MEEIADLNQKDKTVEENVTHLWCPQLISLQEQKERLKCPNHNKAQFACISQQCLRPGLMCLQDNCQCRKNHYKCYHIMLDRVLDSIQKHQRHIPKQAEEAYKCIYDIINNLIEKLSILRTKFQNEEKYFGLKNAQLEFIQLIEDQNIQKINGKIINSLQSTFDIQTHKLTLLTKQDIMRDFESNREKINSLFQHIEKRYSLHSQQLIQKPKQIKLNPNDCDYIFKFLLVGDEKIGKSCLLLKSNEDRFREQYQPTLGVEFGSKMYNINYHPIKIQTWDTSGQQSFKSITRSYYKSCIVAILMYDVTNQTSFQNLQQWLHQIKQSANQKVRIALVGNKIDLSAQRKVSRQKVDQFLQKHKIEDYFQTSALTGQNIQKLYVDLGNKVLNQVDYEKFGVKRGKKRS